MTVRPIRLAMAVLVSAAARTNPIYARSTIEWDNDLELAMLGVAEPRRR